MRYAALRRLLPRFLRRHILHFEASIEDAVVEFAAQLPKNARVLDAGAGEGQYTALFTGHRYTSLDLAVGDAEWDYGKLDCVGDLHHLPFRSNSFEGCLNIVTLEHVTEPAQVLQEICRSLAPGGRILVVVPHAWEVHQAPHDFYRYTLHGITYLLKKAGFKDIRVQPVGGFFRLLSRRLLNGLQFFHGVWFAVAALLLVPPALILPFFEPLDRQHDFTLGYLCTARRLL